MWINRPRFMLQCIVIDFTLNNQPDALIIQILFCYKTLHVSGIFSAHHQEFSTVHSALASFMQVFDDHLQAESGWNSIIQIYSVIKLYMFRTSSVSIIRSFLLYIRHWQVSCRFLMTISKQSQDGTPLSKFILL